MGNSLSNSSKVILTNDNPEENPLEIAREILSGIPLNKDVEIVLDRYQAIKQGH